MNFTNPAENWLKDRGLTVAKDFSTLPSPRGPVPAERLAVFLRTPDGRRYGWQRTREYPMRTEYLQVRGPIIAWLLGMSTHEPFRVIDTELLAEQQRADFFEAIRDLEVRAEEEA